MGNFGIWGSWGEVTTGVLCTWGYLEKFLEGGLGICVFGEVGEGGGGYIRHTSYLGILREILREGN